MASVNKKKKMKNCNSNHGFALKEKVMKLKREFIFGYVSYEIISSATYLLPRDFWGMSKLLINPQFGWWALKDSNLRPPD